MQFPLPTIAAQFDVIGVLATVVVSFLAITLVSSYYRFQHIVQVAEDTQPEEMGAAPEEVLRVQLARYLARCARQGSSFSVALVRCGHPQVPVRMDAPFMAAIRHAARRDDTACVLDDRTAVLLAESEPEDAVNILERIAGALRGALPELLPGQVRVGIASYPGHGLSGRDLLAVAHQGLDMTSGGKSVAMPAIVDVDAEEPAQDEVLPAETESEDQEEMGFDDDGDQAATSWRERRRSSMLDPLTGVLKPSAISPFMQRLMSDLRRQKKPAALFCIGVNNMDYITRFHGQDAADSLLKGISRILQESLRAEDLIGRHEKYAFLVLASASLDEAAVIGKRISTHVQQAGIDCGGKVLKTTITLGVATYPEHGRNLHHLYTAGQRVLDHSRSNDIRAYAVYDPEIHAKVPSKPMKSIKSIQA